MDEKYDHLPESTYGFIYHYYRAEVYRETNWRNRLDVTTNWAIVVTAAILSFVFTNEDVAHTAILVNFVIVWFFLYVESRRFRYYSMLKDRTRLIETHLLSPLLKLGKLPPSDIWRKALAVSLNEPKTTMSRLESVAWRLRRNYIMIFPMIFLAWLAKIQTHPVGARSLADVYLNAKLWFIPGEYVISAFFVSIITTVALALYLPTKSNMDDLP